MFYEPILQVYLDTSAILQYSQTINPTKSERKILKSLYDLYEEGKIYLFTAQGSLSDIFGDNDEKIGTENSVFAAYERDKTRMLKTFPLATDYIESKADFNEDDVILFNILFNQSFSVDNIYEEYLKLNTNDRNDYLILRDFINDANNSSYFITGNPNDFIKNCKRGKIENFAEEKRRYFKVRNISQETLKEIEEQIKQQKI